MGVAPAVLVIDALSYLWSAALLGGIRAVEPPPAPDTTRGSVLGDVAVGFRSCLVHPLVGPVLRADAVTYLFGGCFLALYMIVALRTLGLSPATVGVVISVGGVGAFGGTLVAAPLARALGTGPALIVSLAGGQAANLFIPLALDAGQLAVPLLLLQQLVGDALLTAYAIHSISLRQRTLPHEVLGRANAAFHVVTGALLPTGALLAGAIATTLGVRSAVWIAACGGLLAVPVLAASPVRRLR